MQYVILQAGSEVFEESGVCVGLTHIASRSRAVMPTPLLVMKFLTSSCQASIQYTYEACWAPCTVQKWRSGFKLEPLKVCCQCVTMCRACACEQAHTTTFI